MKRLKDGIQNIVGFALKDVERGVLKTEKGSHAVAYTNETGQGITYTTKKQPNELLVNQHDNSLAYVQGFGENKFVTKYPEVHNKELKNLLEEKACTDILKGKNEISNNLGKLMRENINNKQSYKTIDNSDVEKAKSVLKRIGNGDKINNFFQNLEYFHFYKETKEKGELMLDQLKQTNPEKRSKVFSKYEVTHKNLILLSNDNNLSKEEKKELITLLEDIERTT